MPKLPGWAEGGRVIFDNECPLMFMRKGRREPWDLYAKSGAGWVLIESAAGSSLEKVRKRAMERVGDSIGHFVMALHPGARLKHMRRDWKSHLCAAPYNFETAETVANTTCPVCIAIVTEDMGATVKKIGAEKIEEARERVRQVRDFNTLGRLVTGEDAIEKL